MAFPGTNVIPFPPLHLPYYLKRLKKTIFVSFYTYNFPYIESTKSDHSCSIIKFQLKYQKQLKVPIIPIKPINLSNYLCFIMLSIILNEKYISKQTILLKQTHKFKGGKKVLPRPQQKQFHTKLQGYEKFDLAKDENHWYHSTNWKHPLKEKL